MILGELYSTLRSVADLGLLYSSYVSACVLTSGAQSLYFEITCENLFPVSEAIVSGGLSLLLNVASTVFLLLAMIPGIGKTLNESSQL